MAIGAWAGVAIGAAIGAYRDRPSYRISDRSSYRIIQDELRCVDIADVRKSLGRYAHHGSVHILHTAPESAMTHIATVADPTAGFDESWRWLRRGGGGVFVTQGLADHSVERYAASLSRLCAAAMTSSGRPRPPPPAGRPGSGSSAISGGRKKVFVPKISDDQRL